MLNPLGRKVVEIRACRFPGERLLKKPLVHTFMDVPVLEGIILEHGSELVAGALEELPNSDRVPVEGNCSFHSREAMSH